MFFRNVENTSVFDAYESKQMVVSIRKNSEVIQEADMGPQVKKLSLFFDLF